MFWSLAGALFINGFDIGSTGTQRQIIDQKTQDRSALITVVMLEQAGGGEVCV